MNGVFPMGVETVAIIGAAAALGGAALQADAAKDAAKNRNKPEPTVANENFDQWQQRYLSIIDNYLNKHGIAVPDSPYTPLYGGNGNQPVQNPQAQPTPQQTSAVPVINRLSRTDTTAPASSGTDSTSALISGAGQLGGAFLQSQATKASAGQNGNQPTTSNPYYQPFQQRYQNIFDNFLSTHDIPVKGGDFARPATNTESAPVAATPAVPTPPVAPVPATPPVAPAIEKSSFAGDNSYENAALAAQLGARRLGIVQDAPALETTRDFYERDQKHRQELLNQVYQFIYGQRQLGA